MALFLEPVLQEKMWGGKGLAQYGYDLPNDRIGECWAISGHPHGTNRIVNGPHKGALLSDVWKKHPALFGHPTTKTFPLLTKILDANDRLSVQVHPDDAYAQVHEGELGKTECWYILEAQPGAEIIYGTHATSHEALCQAIDDKDFDRLLKHVPVKAGEFYYVPAGTVHGIGEGIMILETQQSSDTTYRLYDYDRTDQQGQLRPLHLEQSKEVIVLEDDTRSTVPETFERKGQIWTTFVANTFFTVHRVEFQGTSRLNKMHDYMLCSVIEGQGTLNVDGQNYDVAKGTHFILTAEDRVIDVQGDMTWMISYT